MKDNVVLIQAAIDGGASQIYLNSSTPNRTHPVYYRIDSPIIIRKNVVRLHGGWLGLGAPCVMLVFLYTVAVDSNDVFFSVCVNMARCNPRFSLEHELLLYFALTFGV